MILSDTRILEEIEKGTILIEPFRREFLGTNSYDVHLGRYLATYKDRVLDAKEHNKIDTFEIPAEGFVLQPNTLYLGVTCEILNPVCTNRKDLCTYAHPPIDLFCCRWGCRNDVQYQEKCKIQQANG